MSVSVSVRVRVRVCVCLSEREAYRCNYLHLYVNMCLYVCECLRLAIYDVCHE